MADPIRPGDQVATTLTDTTGRTVTTALIVRQVDQLGCGCLRLVADRPGPTPEPRGVHLLTGCAHGHSREIAEEASP